MLDLKVVVVGDTLVGKTCLIRKYMNNEYVVPKDVAPTVFDNYLRKIKVMNENYNMIIWDTAGPEVYKGLRTLCYPNTAIFIICFSLDMNYLLSNVLKKWIPEIKHHCPKTPILLVGTKCDLRKEGSEKFITYDQGEKLCKEIGAIKYIECSAMLEINLSEVFNEASTRAAVNMLTKQKKNREELIKQIKKDKEMKESAELVHKLGECNPS